MVNQQESRLIEYIRSQCKPALGCTEPAAAAYAAAVARRALGQAPEKIKASVSRSILKNAMGVGIPGTDMVGLPAAVALGALCGDAEAELSVLHTVCPEAIAQVHAMLDARQVEVTLHVQCPSLYIEIQLERDGHSAVVVLQDTHTHITRVQRDGIDLTLSGATQAQSAAEAPISLTLSAIDRFIRTVDWTALSFVDTYAKTNEALAHEGLTRTYGMGVGRSLYQNCEDLRSEEASAMALTCAAVDARMSGCMMPAVSSCGSGNQGLMATLPVVTVARMRGLSAAQRYRALAYSLLVTIHVKQHIGKLSPLCACSAGASIGTACALTYLYGGSLAQIERCVQNVVADVSGIICDGAKAGCSLKVATGVASAFRGSMLALRNLSATSQDGIVGATAENSIDNLGDLGNMGMADTDRIILDMLIHK